MEKIKTRYAPTPSGFLHKGNVYSMLLTWLITRFKQGKIYLRIDDIDHQRVQDIYIEDIFRTIEWLGIDYDEGPLGLEDFRKNYSQLNRIDRYKQALDQLKGMGLTFPCTCSRSEIIKLSKNGQYPGTCLLSAPLTSRPHAIRLKTDENSGVLFSDKIIGDTMISVHQQMKYFILSRKDGIPSYQLASLLDDIDLGINCVVRGADLLNSSAAQLYIARLLGMKSFAACQFYHHPLLKSGSAKLSKSRGDRLAYDGSDSHEHRRRLLSDFAGWLGMECSPDDPKDLLAQFSISHLQHLGRTSD